MSAPVFVLPTGAAAGRAGRRSTGPRAGTPPPSCGCAPASRSSWSTVAAAGPAARSRRWSARTSSRSTWRLGRRRAAADTAAGRRAGAAQGRPRRARRRDDDRGRRRRDRAVGGVAVRDQLARRPRREGPGTLAYDGAGGRQAVPPGQVPGRHRAGRHPRRGRPAAPGGGRRRAARGGRRHRWAPSSRRQPARSWWSSGPRAGSAPRSWPCWSEPARTAYRLGPTVLRTSTAGTAALAAVLSRTGRWG